MHSGSTGVETTDGSTEQLLKFIHNSKEPVRDRIKVAKTILQQPEIHILKREATLLQWLIHTVNTEGNAESGVKDSIEAWKLFCQITKLISTVDTVGYSGFADGLIFRNPKYLKALLLALERPGPNLVGLAGCILEALQSLKLSQFRDVDGVFAVFAALIKASSGSPQLRMRVHDCLLSGLAAFSSNGKKRFDGFKTHILPWLLDDARFDKQFILKYVLQLVQDDERLVDALESCSQLITVEEGSLKVPPSCPSEKELFSQIYSSKTSNACTMTANLFSAYLKARRDDKRATVKSIRLTMAAFLFSLLPFPCPLPLQVDVLQSCSSILRDLISHKIYVPSKETAECKQFQVLSPLCRRIIDQMVQTGLRSAEHGFACLVDLATIDFRLIEANFSSLLGIFSAVALVDTVGTEFIESLVQNAFKTREISAFLDRVKDTTLPSSPVFQLSLRTNTVSLMPGQVPAILEFLLNCLNSNLQPVVRSFIMSMPLSETNETGILELLKNHWPSLPLEIRLDAMFRCKQLFTKQDGSEDPLRLMEIAHFHRIQYKPPRIDIRKLKEKALILHLPELHRHPKIPRRKLVKQLVRSLIDNEDLGEVVLNNVLLYELVEKKLFMKYILRHSKTTDVSRILQKLPDEFLNCRLIPVALSGQINKQLSATLLARITRGSKAKSKHISSIWDWISQNRDMEYCNEIFFNVIRTMPQEIIVERLVSSDLVETRFVAMSLLSIHSVESSASSQLVNLAVSLVESPRMASFDLPYLHLFLRSLRLLEIHDERILARLNEISSRLWLEHKSNPSGDLFRCVSEALILQKTSVPFEVAVSLLQTEISCDRQKSAAFDDFVRFYFSTESSLQELFRWALDEAANIELALSCVSPILAGSSQSRNAKLFLFEFLERIDGSAIQTNLWYMLLQLVKLVCQRRKRAFKPSQTRAILRLIFRLASSHNLFGQDNLDDSVLDAFFVIMSKLIRVHFDSIKHFMGLYLYVTKLAFRSGLEVMWNRLARLFGDMKGLKKRLNKYIPYFMVDFVTFYSSLSSTTTTVIPRAVFSACMFRLFDLCDEIEIEIVLGYLNPSDKILLKSIHSDYTTYYQFKGKV